MAAINRIDVQLKTGNRSGAGTDGNVFVAVAGREFSIDSAVDDFEKNSDRMYTLGTGANINYASYNDPSTPYAIDTDDLDRFPAWIRFEPEGSNSAWDLEKATVTVNPGPGQVQFQALNGGNHLWLGRGMGKFCFLKRLPR